MRVVFDLEQQAPAMAGLVLIAAPAHVPARTLGTVGVHRPEAHALRKRHERRQLHRAGPEPLSHAG